MATSRQSHLTHSFATDTARAPRACLLRSLKSIFICAGLLWAAGAVTAPPPDQPANTIRYVKGRFLIQPRPGLSDKELDKLLAAHGGKRAGHIKQINVHVVELPEQANEVAVVRALQTNPHIKFAELDQAVSPIMITSDPSLSNQWHHIKIGSQPAWDLSTGLGVTIAILDTGVEGTHPDLQAAMVPGWNTYDNNNVTTDVLGHGTPVAGAAAAVGNNAMGVAGVAWQSKIMPIRITDPSGYGYFSTMASGITWAADNGARIANISFDGTCGSATVASAAQYLRSKGGVVTVAAGNSAGLILDAPNSALTCVSATDSADIKASFSSYGDAVDVAAPGSSIFTTWRGGGYASASGTSFAAPVAAGVYALMMAANKNLSPATLDSILFSTAKDLGAAGWDQQYGNGRIDAAAAVAKAKSTVVTDTQAPTAAISSPLAGSVVNGLVAVNVTATDNIAVNKVDLYANGALVASDLQAPYSFTWDTSAYADGPASLVAKAVDGAGNIGTSAGVSVTVANDTVAPTVVIVNPLNGSTVSGAVAINVTASDNKRVSKISLSINGQEVALALAPTLSYTWSVSGRTKNRSATSYTINARAWDPSGNQGSTSITVKR